MSDNAPTYFGIQLFEDNNNFTLGKIPYGLEITNEEEGAPYGRPLLKTKSSTQSSLATNTTSELFRIGSINFCDKDDRITFYCENNISTDNDLYQSYVLKRHFDPAISINGDLVTEVIHGFYMRVTPTGERQVTVMETKPWRVGFGANSDGAWTIAQGGSGQTGSKTVQHGTFFTPATGITINSGTMSIWGKAATFVMSWKYNTAISVPAGGNIGNVTIGTFKSGYRPLIRTHCLSDGDNSGMAMYNIQNDGTFMVGSFDGTGTARTIAAGTTNIVGGSFILA